MTDKEQAGAGPLGRTDPVVVIGAGPAGLMAAEVLAEAGHAVEVFDAMASAGRKFLLAGKGGLNLTHSEPFDGFCERYAGASPWLRPLLQAFGAEDLRAWARGLGVETFVGSSGRVFPVDFKSAPLLRHWLHRLRQQGVVFHMRHRWLGWTGDGGLRLAGPAGEVVRHPRATLLALGGGSWARLGSDGRWLPTVAERGVPVRPLQAANCGFDVGWSERLVRDHAGAPLKGVTLRFGDFEQTGEMVLTETGVEGSLVYAVAAQLRDAVAEHGQATFTLDLLPARDAEWVRREVGHGRGSRSLGSHLKSRLNLPAAKAALLWEGLDADARQALGQNADALAARLKACPVTVKSARPMDEAISTAGGIRLEALDARLMLKAIPGVFAAGEMLDWEAPTGGYLLTASCATGRAAGGGMVAWLEANTGPR